LNKHILDPEVQAYIYTHLKDDVHTLVMSKSPFPNVTGKELGGQVAAKNKAEKKLPSWYNAQNIYYPPLLSVEQSSSETTAAYKSSLIIGDNILDITGGFGIDCFYFAKNASQVTHCELDAELSTIAEHNATQLGIKNMHFFQGDGIEHLKNTNSMYSTIYVDPARRSKSGKVFMLKDCSPNVVDHLDLLLGRATRVIIKTSPLLDITAGIRELKNVLEVQIISTKNECKELLFILGTKKMEAAPAITCVAINERIKRITFPGNTASKQPSLLQSSIIADEDITTSNQEDRHQMQPAQLLNGRLKRYLYEPDVALLKSGAFNQIAIVFNLEKLDLQSQLYTSDVFNSEFPGRIFKINEVLSKNELKTQKQISGNVIVRNYPGKPEDLIKTFKIKSSKDEFLIFTRINNDGYVILKASILQHY
jgi:hypothetical protein